jgi:Tol biopolymer transport system component
LVIAALLVVAGCTAEAPEEHSFEAVPASPTPRPSPVVSEPVVSEVVAPGVLSTDDEEYRITFSPDGQEAYFARGEEFFPFSRQATIYRTVREGEGWSAPEVAPFSGVHADIDPFLTADGTRLYFSSIRPPREDADLFVVERSGDGWGEPRNLGAVNSEAEDLYPTVDSDGTLYFGSDRPGGLGGWDLYTAAPDGADGFQAPAPLPAPVNSPNWDYNPALTPDGSTLVFVSQARPAGAGRGDFFAVPREGDGWGARIPLTGGDMTTHADEYHPSFSPDGSTLYFVRQPNTGGDGDLRAIPWSLP